MTVKIPKRTSTVRTPAYEADRKSVTTIGPSMRNLGRVYQDHVDRIQAQHDVATSQTLIREFRDIKRSEMAELTSREGADAKGSLEEYKFGFDKDYPEFESRLENDTQKRFFRQSADATRRQDLDVLSVHQAKQHKAHLLGNYKSQSASAESEIAQNPHPNNIEYQMSLLEDSVNALNPGVDNSAALHEERKKLEVMSLKTLSVLDPVSAERLVEEWKKDLGDLYEPTRAMVMKEYIHKTADQKFPGDFNEQYDYAKNFPDVPEDVRVYAMNRINALESETTHRENVAYSNLKDKTGNHVSGLIRQGKYDEAMKVVASTPGLEEMDKLSLENVIQSNMGTATDPLNDSDVDFVEEQIELARTGKLDPLQVVPIPGMLSKDDANMVRGIAERINNADPFSDSDQDFVEEQIDLARNGELTPEEIVAVPGMMSRTDANMVRGIAERVRKAKVPVDPFSVSDSDFVAEQVTKARNGELKSELVIAIPNQISRTDATMIRGIAERFEKEVNGESNPKEIRARKAIIKVIEDMDLDKREEALLIGNKLNEFDEHTKKNPNVDFMKYVDEDLLAEEKGSAIGRWLQAGWDNVVNYNPSVQIDRMTDKLVDKFIGGGNSPRNEAIRILQEQGEPVTENNIQFVIDSPED